jgi:hypothetical protein
MFKIQVVFFALLGTITYHNVINSNTLTLEGMDRYPECVNKPRSHFTAIDSTQVIVRVGNITRVTASTNEIIAHGGLRIVLKGYPADFKVAVFSFDITTVTKNSDTLAVNVGTRGNLLSKDQIQELKKLKGSGKIIFHNIKAVAVSGTIRTLDPFSLTVRG